MDLFQMRLRRGLRVAQRGGRGPLPAEALLSERERAGDPERLGGLQEARTGPKSTENPRFSMFFAGFRSNIARN